MLAFLCRYATFQSEVMPFGLINAPSTFQRMMDGLIIHQPFVRVYWDDVAIFPSDLKEHIERMGQVVTLVADRGLKVIARKCEFAKEKVELLDHIIDEDGVRVNPKKVEIIANTPCPRTQTEFCSFLGTAGHCRPFFWSFAIVSASWHAAASRKV